MPKVGCADRMRRRASILLTALIGAVGCEGVALAQIQSRPIIGGTGGLSVDDGRFDLSGPPQQHLTPAKKPCVRVNGLSSRQIINSTIYEHILIIENSCSQPIKLQLCYFQSTNCVKTTITAYARKQQVLGVAPNAKDFRFSYTEEFP